MKLLQNTIALSLSSLSVKANEATKTHISQEMESYIEENPEIAAVLNPPIQRGRSLLEPGREEGTSLNFLNGYGCWCNFDNYKHGAGIPLDDYDRSCKKLHDNYRCIEEEFADQGETCLPAEINYISAMLYVYIVDAIYANELGMDSYVVKARKQRFEDYCAEKNPTNRCAVEACLAEAHFLYEISPQYNRPADSTFMTYAGDYGYAPKSRYNHDQNSAFIHSNECRGRNPRIEVHAEPQCCGVTPNRVRYHSAQKLCCENSGEVYNLLTQECCINSSGGVEKIGEC